MATELAGAATPHEGAISKLEQRDMWTFLQKARDLLYPNRAGGNHSSDVLTSELLSADIPIISGLTSEV